MSRADPTGRLCYCENPDGRFRLSAPAAQETEPLMPAPLDVLIVSDGRPGHYNLSEGIALALGKLRPTVLRRLEVRRGRWPGRVTGWMTKTRLAPATVLRWIYGVSVADIPAAGVVVSAGAETLAASVAIARLRSIPNIHYGSLRNFEAAGFSLVLTSYAGRATARPHAFVPKPGRFDPDDLGPPSDPRAWPDEKPAVLGLAIGGDAPGCQWTPADWDNVFATVDALTRRYGIVWRVSNSRRTSGAISDRVADLARAGRLATFVDVRVPGAPRLWDAFRDVDAVLVTADSSSMVSEAVFARRPVIAIAPVDMRLADEEAAYRAWLAAERRQATLATDGLDAETVLASLREIVPDTGNPLTTLAHLIAERVPGLKHLD